LRSSLTFVVLDQYSFEAAASLTVSGNRSSHFVSMLEIHDIEGKLGALYYGSAFGSLTMIYRRFSVIYSTLCFDSEAFFFPQTHKSRDRTVLGSSFHRSVKEQQESKLLQETASTHFPTTHYRLIGISGLDSYI
jgi:hypothetical protein